MAAFPAAKLGALVLKQVSKPIANWCKNYAKSTPFFRKYICMPPAQLYHWSEVKMKMWILNLGKPVNIPVLNEQQAIELGANLLGEGVIFAIAAVILVSEYNRSAAKEAKKEAHIKAEKRKLEQSLDELYFATQKQATQINELIRLVYDIEGRVPRPGGADDPRGDKPQAPTPAPAPGSNIPEVGGFNPPSLNHGEGPERTSAFARPISNISYTKQQNSQVLNCAYEFVENELFTDEQYSPSLVTLGINHLYYNVYRVPVSA